MKISLTVMLLALVSCAAPAFAAGSREREAQYDSKRYEITFSGAYCPGRQAFGYNFSYPFHGLGISDIYRRHSFEERYSTSGTWIAAFICNFTKTVALEASLSYEGGRRRIYRKADAVGYGAEALSGSPRSSTDAEDYITPMATLRISWFRRQSVRLYSSFGAGLSFCIRKKEALDASGSRSCGLELFPALQLNPVGVTVGKKVYGLAELGFGNLYCGGRLGVGYVF